MSVSAEGFMIAKMAILTSDDDSQDPYFSHLPCESGFWGCPFSTRGPLAEPPSHGRSSSLGKKSLLFWGGGAVLKDALVFRPPFLLHLLA